MFCGAKNLKQANSIYRLIRIKFLVRLHSNYAQSTLVVFSGRRTVEMDVSDDWDDDISSAELLELCRTILNDAAVSNDGAPEVMMQSSLNPSDDAPAEMVIQSSLNTSADAPAEMVMHSLLNPGDAPAELVMHDSPLNPLSNASGNGVLNESPHVIKKLN